jgi:hypothetical protein
MAKAKASKATSKSQAKSVKKAHAATGKVVSPTEDPTDRSTSAVAIAGATSPKDKSGAAVSAKSIDAVSRTAKAKEAEERAELDNSIVGKISRSGLFFVRDHSVGTEYVGQSPQNDPKANEASKLRSLVAPLNTVAPRTGMTIRAEDGTSWSVGEGFGPESTPADWAKVTSPSGDPLFA